MGASKCLQEAPDLPRLPLAFSPGSKLIRRKKPLFCDWLTYPTILAGVRSRLVDLAMISKIAMARSAMVKHRDLRSDGDGLKTIFFLLKTLDTWSFKLCLKHKKRCISNKNLETAEIIRIIGYETLLYYGV